jgi:hypothetical protein
MPIKVKARGGRLWLMGTHESVRVRESTGLEDIPANQVAARRKAREKERQIEEKIAAGEFAAPTAERQTEQTQLRKARRPTEGRARLDEEWAGAEATLLLQRG